MNTDNYKIKILVLGCGTSTGVPAIACDCKVCSSTNEKNKRMRPSVYLTVSTENNQNETNILIDTSIDLWHQAIKYKLKRVDSILFTHAHADHINGIDEIRTFNYLQKTNIPCFMSKDVEEEFRHKFSYIFNGPDIGGGIPKLTINQISHYNEFSIRNDIKAMPLFAMHGPNPITGYRIGNFAYLTDVTEIPEKSLDSLKNLDVLFIDCLRYRPHSTHLHLDKALDYIKTIKPKQAYFTHMCHDFDYDELLSILPENIKPAYDGLIVEV